MCLFAGRVGAARPMKISSPQPRAPPPAAPPGVAAPHGIASRAMASATRQAALRIFEDYADFFADPATPARL